MMDILTFFASPLRPQLPGFRIRTSGNAARRLAKVEPADLSAKEKDCSDSERDEHRSHQKDGHVTDPA